MEGLVARLFVWLISFQWRVACPETALYSSPLRVGDWLRLVIGLTHGGGNPREGYAGDGPHPSEWDAHTCQQAAARERDQAITTENELTIHCFQSTVA